MVQAPGVQACPPTPSPWEGTRACEREGDGSGVGGEDRREVRRVPGEPETHKGRLGALGGAGASSSKTVGI